MVEDEPDLRRFFRASLTTHPHEVVEADYGTLAISQLREQNPDLIILDLGLPDTDGVEVTRRVRKWNQVPIIILSVCSRAADKIEALNAGAGDYLTKPFGVGELLKRKKLMLILALVHAFLLSLLSPALTYLRIWLMGTWCHSNGKRNRSAAAPLYRLHLAFSVYWLAFRPFSLPRLI